MATRFDNLTNGLYEWAKRHTDLADWGYKSPRDGVVSANTNEQYEKGLNRRGWPQKLTKTIIHGHRTGFHTIYYRSAAWAPVQALMIDVDAHHGEDDAIDLAMFLLSLFPGSYLEPSTNGKGFHIFAHVALGTINRQVWDDLAEVLQQALIALRCENNYRASVELKGLATTTIGAWVDDPFRPGRQVYRYRVERRGSLAKLPRLAKGEQELRSLLGSPVYDLDHCRQVVELAPPDLGLVEAWDRALNPDSAPLASMSTISTSKHKGCVGELNKGREGKTSSRQPDGTSIKHKGCVGDLASYPDALHRMRRAGMILARSLGRLPTAEELVQFYESQGLNSGDDVGGRRLKRAASVIEWLGGSFDPALASGQGFTDNLPSVLAAIRQHVKPGHREDTGYRWRITDEDLAVVVYVVTKGAFLGRFDCSNGSIESLFKVLRAAGVVKRSCDRNKAVACKTILERAGLIACHNQGYVVGLKGKEYVPGVNHPRYAEFRAMMQEHVAPRRPVVEAVEDEPLPAEAMDRFEAEWMEEQRERVAVSSRIGLFPSLLIDLVAAGEVIGNWRQQ